jgi:hypothetical protein
MSIDRTRLVLAALFAGLILLGTPAPAQAQLGIAGGLNFESIDDIQASGNAKANFESSTGYHLGVVYELGLGPIALRPGVFYRRVGEFDLSEVSDDLSDPRYTVSAWEVPVDVRIELLSTPLISPYILGGPKATIPRGEGDFDDAVADLSYTLNVGVGAQISLPGSSLRLQPELRYEFGATSFIDEDTRVELGENSVEFQPQDSPQFSTFAVRLNLLF